MPLPFDEEDDWSEDGGLPEEGSAAKGRESAAAEDNSDAEELSSFEEGAEIEEGGELAPGKANCGEGELEFWPTEKCGNILRVQFPAPPSATSRHFTLAQRPETFLLESIKFLSFGLFLLLLFSI